MNDDQKQREDYFSWRDLSDEQIRSIIDERVAIAELNDALDAGARADDIPHLINRYNETDARRTALGVTDHQLGADRIVRDDVGSTETRTLDQLREAIGEVIHRERNEDGMIRIPWRRDPKEPFVVQVTPPGGTPQYLSAAGIRDEGPMVDGITKAALFERKGDAKHFAHLAGEHLKHGQGEPGVPSANSEITVVTEYEARTMQQVPERQLWTQVVDDCFQRLGGFEPSEAHDENLMSLAQQTGTPRWAILAAAYQEIGRCEAGRDQINVDRVRQAALAEHHRLGIVRPVGNERNLDRAQDQDLGFDR